MNCTRCLTDIDLELQNNFRERKLYTRYLYQSYTRLHEKNFSSVGFDFGKKSESVESCAKFLKFGHVHSGAVKLHKAYFCRDKLCPMCAWRRSKKIYNQVYTCVDFLKDDYQFLMLTLTVPNVSASELSSTITHLNESFARLIGRVAVKRICKGYLKCLEITYNRKRDDFHPHFHVLLAVGNDYFKSDFYLKQDDFLRLWRESTRDNSITQVDIRKIHYNSKRPELNNIASAVAEVAKYAVKPSDYIFTDSKILTDRVVYTFSTVLHRRRLVSFGGVFEVARKHFGFVKDVFEDDLLHVDDNSKDGEFVAFSSYVWFGGRYHLYAIEVPDKFVLTCSDDFFVDLQTGEVLVE